MKLTDYPQPSVTIDCVIFGYDGSSLSVLLLNRKEAPFKNSWTLPGGFLQLQEGLEDCAARVLYAKTGLRMPYLEQLGTFGDVKRDPRGRVLSVSYYALVNPLALSLTAGKAANEVKWFPVTELPVMGFDHKQIFAAALSRLRAKVTYQPIGFELLEKKFTLTELQLLYECILERNIDKRNFRKRLLESGILTATGLKKTGLKNRAPGLFEFNETAYKKLLRDGYQFKI